MIFVKKESESEKSRAGLKHRVSEISRNDLAKAGCRRV